MSSADKSTMAPRPATEARVLFDQIGRSDDCLLLGWVQTLIESCVNYLRQRDIKKRAAACDRRIKEWASFPKSTPEITAYNAQRFDFDDQALVEHLQEHGFVVVKGVADESDVEKAKTLLWQFLEERANMRRQEPATWTDHRFAAVGNPTNGIVSGNGFGHSEVSWFIRTLPNVKAIFSVIWRTDSLITSFDGGNVFRPFHAPEHARHRTQGGWWHVDQGHHKRGLHAVQGLVLLTDATVNTGGLCVVPGSHRQHAELLSYTVTSPDGSDYVAVPAPQINPSVRHGTLVCARAGDAILWDSRLMHCNTPALEPPSAALGYAENELLRAAIYVCMTPRRFADRATLALRRSAALAGVGSSHWPHDFKPAADPSLLVPVDEAQLEEAVRAGLMSREQWALI